MDEFVPTSYTVSAWVKVPVVKAMGIVGRTTADGISSVLSDDLHITAGGVFEHYTSSGSSDTPSRVQRSYNLTHGIMWPLPQAQEDRNCST